MRIIGRILFGAVIALFSTSNYIITLKIIPYWIFDTYKAPILGIMIIIIY
jgi:hypothetical protein